MDKKEKIKYELDPFNRLIAKKTGNKSEVRAFREVIDGTFKVDKNNTLKYHAKIPGEIGSEFPHQIKLNGQWSLTKDHKLLFTLNKRGRGVGDQLTFESEILDVKKNSLVFVVTTRSRNNIVKTYILDLRGKWQADKNNCLTFGVKREGGKHDLLTFDGKWEINKNHQLIYKYVTGSLVRKEKQLRTLTFKGHWEINDKTHITYLVENQSDSSFKFRAGIGIFKDKSISYEVGIGRAKGKVPVKQTVILYGNWKIKGRGKLVFEVEYEKGKLYAIAFNAEAKLTDKNSVKFKLKNELNQRLGAEIELTRGILKGNGELFIRCLASRKEKAVSLGVGFRW